jgi:hypothetical protein
MTTDTPRTDACLHCGAARLTGMIAKAAWECGNANTFERSRSELCKEREARQKAEARLAEAEDLIKRGHDGWKKAEAEAKDLKLELAVSLKNQLKAMQDVETLRKQLSKVIKIADRACNLLNLKGGYHESYELRNELSSISE